MSKQKRAKVTKQFIWSLFAGKALFMLLTGKSLVDPSGWLDPKTWLWGLLFAIVAIVVMVRGGYIDEDDSPDEPSGKGDDDRT